MFSCHNFVCVYEMCGSAQVIGLCMNNCSTELFCDVVYCIPPYKVKIELKKTTSFFMFIVASPWSVHFSCGLRHCFMLALGIVFIYLILLQVSIYCTYYVISYTHKHCFVLHLDLKLTFDSYILHVFQNITSNCRNVSTLGRVFSEISNQ